MPTHTLLRQSVRYCLVEENHGGKGIRKQLPKLFDQYKLEGMTLGHTSGRRRLDRQLQQDNLFIVVRTGRRRERPRHWPKEFLPSQSARALSLAANSLLLHDPGRKEGSGNKPVGSCHGDSVGVHAVDAINAWRNIARVSNHHNAVASLVVGAYSHLRSIKRHEQGDLSDHPNSCQPLRPRIRPRCWRSWTPPFVRTINTSRAPSLRVMPQAVENRVRCSICC